MSQFEQLIRVGNARMLIEEEMIDDRHNKDEDLYVAGWNEAIIHVSDVVYSMPGYCMSCDIHRPVSKFMDALKRGGDLSTILDSKEAGDVFELLESLKPR